MTKAKDNRPAYLKAGATIWFCYGDSVDSDDWMPGKVTRVLKGKAEGTWRLVIDEWQGWDDPPRILDYDLNNSPEIRFVDGKAVEELNAIIEEAWRKIRALGYETCLSTGRQRLNLRCRVPMIDGKE